MGRKKERKGNQEENRIMKSKKGKTEKRNSHAEMKITNRDKKQRKQEQA